MNHSRRVLLRLLLLALGITATLVAWGVLVYAAIGFGRDARSETPEAWWFFGIATVGAAACLFVTLLLGVRVVDLVRQSPADREQLVAKRPAPRRLAGRN